MAKWIPIGASFLLAACSASSAFAQAAREGQPADVNDDMPGPARAFEIGVDGGYTQPFGGISPGRRIGDLVDAGGGVSLNLAYRMNPRWAFGAFAHFHESNADSTFVEDVAVRGGAAGLQVLYHFLPWQSAEPYLGFGSGYRALWIVPDGEQNHVLHGLDIARLSFGIDFRVTPSVAFGPVVGADLDLWLWDDEGGLSFSHAVESPRPTTFVFAGLAAHFDVGGSRTTRTGQAVPWVEEASGRDETLSIADR